MTEWESKSDDAITPLSTRRLARTGVAGILMGLANLVPGISGGTMIVVMGLYDDFVSSIADVTRLKFSKRKILFLAVLGTAALAAIGSCSELLSRAMALHRSAMLSLFIGMTLGGVPLLLRMLKKSGPAALAGGVLGLALMITVALTQNERPDSQAIKQAVAAGNLIVEPSYTRDAVAGVLGMSAMVLPGISGAYMLLIIGRYETILAAISMCKNYVTSLGDAANPAAFLRVLVPVAFGAGVSLLALSNLLKWMLHTHTSFTVGLLLGILCGSVIGIWPFDAQSTAWDFVTGAGLAMAGFIATVALGRLGR